MTLWFIPPHHRSLPRSLGTETDASHREGAFTVVFGVVSFWLLPRDPASVFYLKSHQTEALLAALDKDRPPAETHEKLTWSSILSALKAPHVWLVGAQLFASGTALFSMAYFVSSAKVVPSLTFSVADHCQGYRTQGHCCPAVQRASVRRLGRGLPLRVLLL